MQFISQWTLIFLPFSCLFSTSSKLILVSTYKGTTPSINGVVHSISTFCTLNSFTPFALFEIDMVLLTAQNVELVDPVSQTNEDSHFRYALRGVTFNSDGDVVGISIYFGSNINIDILNDKFYIK